LNNLYFVNISIIFEKRGSKQLFKTGSKDVLHEDDHFSKSNEKLIEEENKKREAEKLLQQRFKTFDLFYKDIVNLLEAWDRTQGNIYRQPSPSEKSEHEDPAIVAKNKKAPVKNPQVKEKNEKDKKEKDKNEIDNKNKTETIPNDTTEIVINYT
jgi:hypothetical protein